jgi:ferric-dicitrate binding protein FerR (iron transport regulator)
MEYGRVQAVIQKQPNDVPFVFETPHAAGTVVSAALRMVAEDRVTLLEVTEGQVRLRRLSDGAEVTVNAGESVSTARSAPFAPRPISREPR